MDKLTRQPRALYLLFFVEMWERFSFYGMRALLVLYMTKALLFTDDRAYALYGAYGALVYATPVLGGWLADRVLGYQRAIILGAVLLGLGHFCMAVQQPVFFYGGLTLLICGNGFFKPNISSLVGQLYLRDDPRRDAGFTIFYIGINTGAFLAPLLCGYIGETYGWHYGFGLAGIGMAIGLAVFMRGRHLLGSAGLPPRQGPLRKSLRGFFSIRTLPYFAVATSLPVFAVLLLNDRLSGWVLLGVGVAVLGWLLFTVLSSAPPERGRLLVIVILLFFNMTFWSFFEQAGSSINLFTERNVDRVLEGWTVPASLFQSVNPLFIILLGPLFSTLWRRLGRVGLEPGTPVKFALGILQLALGFAALAFGAGLADAAGKTSLWWLVLGYALMTGGELSLSPVGLSMVTRLAPREIVGAVMGAWFLSVAFAHYLAAAIARLSSVRSIEGAGEQLAPAQTALLYGDLFRDIAWTAGGVSLLLLLLAPSLRRRMQVGK